MPWSRCQTCGQDFPAPQIQLNPRFGWQCPQCWDGLIQRDQILQPIFPYEGTRRVASPLTDTLLEGIAPGSLYQTYEYYLRDRATAAIWKVKLVPLFINATGSVVYTSGSTITLTSVVSTDEHVFAGIRINNGWILTVTNGSLGTIQDTNALNILDGACDFGEGSTMVDFLLYDRDIKTDIYRVDFGPEVIEVLPASGPATGGILLNYAPAPPASTWNFYIQGGVARYDDLPYPELIAWDGSHTFYVNDADPMDPLVYIP